MPSTYPRWKFAVLILTLFIGLIYALPNLYGDDPALQVSGIKGQVVNEETLGKVKTALDQEHIQTKSIHLEDSKEILVRFLETESQLKAKDLVKKALGEEYSVALNLAPVTPQWLRSLGAHPMKLGLDLRGGVYFLMEVDLDSVIARRLEGYYLETPKLLREAKLRYKSLSKQGSEGFRIGFDSLQERNDAQAILQKHQSDLSLQSEEENNLYYINAALSPIALKEIRNEIVEQTLATLRNRVNELGVAEAIVQRHGLNRIVVELPGIQDTAYAKDILGKTATLKFLLMDEEHDIESVLKGHPVIGSKLYYDRSNRPILFKNQVVLSGEMITGASTGQDRDGRPSVNIRLGGEIGQFSKTTRDNVGRRMGTIYVEIKEGKLTETVINVATIQSALGNSFQITGMGYEESRDLSLLLRAGALPAALSIVEERIVGPSMGQENIEMGMISVLVGLGLVLGFMAIYYSVFGWIANLALLGNLILLVALLSLIGNTLTLPGIAAIVLTLGMAVDANVLIFERIREELRLGLSPKASIQRGFEFAFATILDSNLTTLIVGVILFAVGSGPVKGFAVVLCLGILTSLYTATTGSRALVELIYGSRNVKRLRIGI